MNFVITEDKNFLKLVGSTDTELAQLKLDLKKRIKSWRFHPLCRRNVWDGYINFMDSFNRIPIGLWYNVQQICERYKYDFNVKGLDEYISFDIDEDDFIKYLDTAFANHPKIKPHEYQINAALKIIKWQRCIAELATSAGKTLIMFMIFSYLMHTKRIKKMLIIVPRTSLVIQTTEDFENYSMDKKTIKYKSQMIGGGRDKSKSDVNLVVGTYQSLSKLDPDFFKEFDIVCVDESQSADSTSVKKILKMCTGVKYKFGLSGTTKTAGDTAESLTMISLLGPLVEKVSGKYLTDNGFATPIKIKMIFMDYLDEEMKVKLMRLRTKLKAMKSLGDSSSDGSKMLSIEQQIITENKKRFAFIINVISRLNKNSLVLFKDVKNSYGKKIYQKLKRTMPDEYEIFYIDGSTDEKSRELYKKRMDSNDGRPRILVASFGTFSTGISINALNNVVFVESYKSEVIIKQSIGRGMRKDKDKDVVYIVDFVDNFAIDGYDNYTLKHAYEREQIYKHEKYIYNKVSVKL